MADVEDIVKWIVFQCREKGHPVTESLAAYIAHTTVNPSTTKFFLEDPISTESDAKKLVELAVAKLGRNSASMETLKMQIAYDSSFVQQQTFEQHFINVQSQETNSYIDDIVNCETRSGSDFEGITLLYKRIFSFLLFRNKLVGLNFANVIIKPGGGMNSLGTITNAVVNPNIPAGILNTMEREVAAALESVLPRPGLRPFVAMSTPEKVSQLMELSNIVVGIRLYNKETGKGGVGLESFEQLVSHPSRELINQVNREVLSTLEVCEDMILVLKSATKDYKDWKEQLTHRRQYLTYLIAIQEEAQSAEIAIESLHSRYIRELVELKELIGNKTSIPKDQVYPKFDTLCQVYNQMNDEKNKSILRKELFNILIEHKARVPITLPKELVVEIKKKSPETPERIEGDIIGSKGVQRLTSETTPDFMHLPLDYQGFCIWSLVRRDGLLVPGKPTLGVVKYRERYFVFSNPAALSEFMENPSFFLDECINVARNKPEIIHLLRMTEDFPNCSLTHLLQGKDGTPLFSVTAPLMLDQSAETPLHFVESNIDTNYHWNEWELRRKALQMADIRKKQTTSAQTDLSNFKRDGETQVYLPKELGTQTMQTKWSDMDWTLNRMYMNPGEKPTDETHGLETRLNYIVGVRGADKWKKSK
ncbi:hypothetical protein SteCoe_33979 [Stentor coeruleus]|uniref:Cilia- and flagella-associated protein 206 n=1 Tax=Stentor coeruleus TaxID=5963 RepID=A0A1R2AVI7_9CILI|nr:hypothetical protein SteCoe_33979 [Stentor coeruleus]